MTWFCCSPVRYGKLRHFLGIKSDLSFLGRSLLRPQIVWTVVMVLDPLLCWVAWG